MNHASQEKGRPVPWSFGSGPTSSPASSTPRCAASGLDLGPEPKEWLWCRRRLGVSFAPEGKLLGCAGGPCSSLAVGSVERQNRGVSCFCVSGVGFSPEVMALRAKSNRKLARSAIVCFPCTPWLNLLFRVLRVILACSICDPHTMRISGTRADAFCQMRLPWMLDRPCASRVGAFTTGRFRVAVETV
jgi:hypothetical protein